MTENTITNYVLQQTIKTEDRTIVRYGEGEGVFSQNILRAKLYNSKANATAALAKNITYGKGITPPPNMSACVVQVQLDLLKRRRSLKQSIEGRQFNV